MQNKPAYLIFTDLDGTLLNQDDYRYDAALPVIDWLRSHQIPVIAVTSKTRQEVEHLQNQLNLSDPFVVENGSGVFIRSDDNRFAQLPDRLIEPWANYQLLRLGVTYSEARQGLRQISAALGERLRGFGDLSGAEVEQLTGLSAESVQRAQAREFTEPFITPDQSTPEQLTAIVQAHGFRMVVGDRFSHLIGHDAGKGKAVELLIESYEANLSQQPLITIGLGNSPNDLGMLEVVDIPIIVPGLKGPHPGLMRQGWQVALAPGAQGWAMTVKQICVHL